MLKLYNTINGKLHYWESWEKDGKTAIIHWGKVGDKGEHKEIKSGFLSGFRKTVRKEADVKMREGFHELDEENLASLEIEYLIDGFGSETDLEKRHRLEEYLDKVLGWTGLGHVDGGSIGSGTMEVGCVVVDFELAKRVIELHLKDKEFGNFSRIFQINDEE